LMAPQAATVVESHVAEGRAVRRGDVLFVLSVGQDTASGDAQAAIQSSLASRERSLQDAARQRGLLEQNQIASLELQIGNMHRELGSIDAEAGLQRERLALAQKSLAQLESLQSSNFVSSAQVRTKAEEILGLKAQLQHLERQRGTQL